MKKPIILSLFLCLCLSLFVSCNGSVDDRIFYCTVTFEKISSTYDDNSSQLSPMYVRRGSLIPADAFYDNYCFYYDKNKEEQFDLYEDRITRDITLYYESNTCVAKGTLISMADGSQKAVENISVGDTILSYNFYTGIIEPKKVLFKSSYYGVEKKILTIKTQNGKLIDIIGCQTFFDAQERKELYIDNKNYGQMVGKQILVKENDSLAVDTIKEITSRIEVIDSFDVVTENNINFFGNDILTVVSLYIYIFPFELDENYKVNSQKMAEDIAEYGLLTYEEYPVSVPRAVFDGLNMKYNKILVGKGYVTWDIIRKGYEVFSDYLQDY